MRAFPDVKVILTTRDPRTWYQSIKKLYDGHCLVETTWSFPLVTWLLDGRKDRDWIFGQTKTFNPWSFVPEGIYGVDRKMPAFSYDFYSQVLIF